MREIVPAVPGLDLRREYGHHQNPAIRAGGLVFCSGMVAIDPETGERQHGTVTTETCRIFENLKLLLETAGASLERLLQVHAMIYDRIEYDVLNRVYRRYVPSAPPARTVMSVQIEAGFKVMLDVIAAAHDRLDGTAASLPRQAIGPGDKLRSPAIRAGDFVFISGMEAAEHGTVAAETRQILTNMAQVLSGYASLHHSTPADVLKWGLCESTSNNRENGLRYLIPVPGQYGGHQGLASGLRKLERGR